MVGSVPKVYVIGVGMTKVSISILELSLPDYLGCMTSSNNKQSRLSQKSSMM